MAHCGNRCLIFFQGQKEKDIKAPRFNMYPRVCFRYVFDGFTKSPPHPSIKLGQQKAQVGRMGAVPHSITTQAREIRGLSRGGTSRRNSRLEGILKRHLNCPPKSSEAGSFYFERAPGKDTQKPLSGRAITVLTALTRWRFNPPNSSPAMANTG